MLDRVQPSWKHERKLSVPQSLSVCSNRSGWGVACLAFHLVRVVRGEEMMSWQLSAHWSNHHGVMSDTHRLDKQGPNTNSIKTERHQATPISSFWHEVVSFTEFARVCGNHFTFHLLMETMRCGWKLRDTSKWTFELRPFYHIYCFQDQKWTFTLKFIPVSHRWDAVKFKTQEWYANLLVSPFCLSIECIEWPGNESMLMQNLIFTQTHTLRMRQVETDRE